MNRYVIFFISAIVCAASVVVAQERISPKETDALRIMCYNVRNCRGMDNAIDYKRVADIMNRLAPDVIAVQELDSATQRSEGVFVLNELAMHTHMHYVYASAIDFQCGKYGVGILSKEKPLSYKKFPLPGREEKRMFLLVEFEHYVFCCTHFSLTPEDRQASVPIINEAIAGMQKPVFVAGDMNSVHGSPEQLALCNFLEMLSDHTVNTIPVVNPNRCIDFIYGFKNGYRFDVLQRKVLQEETVASDHLPLFLDVRVASKQ